MNERLFNKTFSTFSPSLRSSTNGSTFKEGGGGGGVDRIVTLETK